MTDFKEGMVTRVFVKDFLTYGSVEFFPNSKLNMIVGPNGTGKSSIVNAIVLGLGGKTQVIGRAKQLAAFVRNGCERANIEIELFHKPKNYVIGRSFNIENQNSWTVNGKASTFKQVEEVVGKFNIQIDNLCQFLPQDKVQDFAKMDSKQLLENTLKTVGSAEIIENHSKLKQLREKDVNFGTATNTVKQQLDSEKKKLASLETEVKAQKEREDVLRSIQNVEKKKGWMEYKIKESKKQEVLSDRKKILDMKTKAEEQLDPLDGEIKKTKEEIKVINVNINKEMRLNGDTASSIKTKFNAAACVEDNIHSLETELGHKLEMQRRKAQKITSLQEQINSQEALLDPNKETELTQQISVLAPKLEKGRSNTSRVKEYIQVSHDKVSDYTREKNRLQSEIEREQSATDQKLRLLNQRYPDTFKAYQWLKENRNKFAGAIYGPIMLEVNCSKEWAKYVEFVIPVRELIMFVCEKAEDATRMMRTVRDEMKLRINVAQATKNPHRPPRENYPAPYPIESLRQFGFSTYILDEVQAENPVLNYLCQNFGVHQIPVGNNKTNNMVDHIPKNISYYFSDTKNFVVRVSKFSGEKSSRIVEVRNGIYLASSVNTALIASCEVKLQQVTADLSKEVQNLDTFKNQLGLFERELNSLQSQKRDLGNELLQFKTRRTKLKMLKDEIESLIRENDINPEEEREVTNRKIRKRVLEASRDQRAILGHFKCYQDSLAKIQLQKIKISMGNQILRIKEEGAMEAKKQLEDLKRMLTNVEEQLRDVQREMKKAHEDAKRLTDGLSPGYPEFNRKYGDIFDSLPNELEGLDAEISNLSARADCLAGGRARVIEDYENTKKLINRLESDFGSSDKRLQNLKGEMETLRNVWIPQVSALIEQINKNFSNFFRQMKCVGEVSLEAPVDKDDYSKYGICIKVQFRESGKLQKLDSHVQSGGERAVSTAIYMLSLQELTTVPFRCVDEINQGMDEHNERMVFNLMVKTVEQSNSAQCFLLTPKILQNLDMKSPYLTLHSIYSGFQTISHFDFSIQEHMNKSLRTIRKSQSFRHSTPLMERDMNRPKRPRFADSVLE